MNSQHFTHYIVAGSSMKPKLSLPDGIRVSTKTIEDFEAFASQHEFPISNPEMLNGRMELNRDEVEAVHSGYEGDRYWIKGHGEPNPDQSIINVKVLIRQTGTGRDGKGNLIIKESDLIDYFEKGLHLKNYTDYDYL